MTENIDGKKVAGVDRESYFGWKNLDKDDIKTDSFTIKLEHAFNDSLSLQNLTRYSQIDRNTVISASHEERATVGCFFDPQERAH
mgnify:CR=1 FL=1